MPIAPHPITTDIEASLTIEVEGMFAPSTAVDAEVGIYTDTISDICISKLIYTTYGSYRAFRRTPIHHNLLEGVDTSLPDVQLLLSNLLGFIVDEAAEALLEAGRE